jgi:hypothetical protein
MRRIAAAALAAGAVLAATVAVAGPADAATAHSWQTADGWGTLRGYGTWTHTSSGHSVKLYLQDSRTNGWSPGVQFRTYNSGYAKKTDSVVYYFVDNRTGRPADGKFSQYRGAYTKGYNSHLYVREVGVRVSDKHLASGPWKKLY